MKNYSLKNGVAVPNGDVFYKKNISVANGRISDVGDMEEALAVDVSDSFVYPALINTHDHLRGNYVPRVGPKTDSYYLNWLPWDNDLKASPCYAERTKALDIDSGYLLSAYKTLFSGVVTVSDHFLHSLNKDILPTLPVRALRDYGIAHECSSIELKWGGPIEEEHRYACEHGVPFITHLCEGFDEESMAGLAYLESKGALDNHCLLVHCIGFSDEDIKKCAAAKASISICCSSNMFMFNVTSKVKKFLDAGINVTIGTDSSHTGLFNLLEEIKYDRCLYRKMYGEDLSAKRIFKMVTVNSAKAFWMQKDTGTLETGKYADILVLGAKYDDPWENFYAARSRDIELLIYAGKPVWGEARFLPLLGGKLPAGYTMLKIGGRDMFVIGDPLALYRMIREKVGFKKIIEFLPFEPDEQEDYHG